jgi:hypothetical protein
VLPVLATWTYNLLCAHISKLGFILSAIAVSDKLEGAVHNFMKIIINTHGDKNENMKRSYIICGVLSDGLILPGYHVYW